jgi:FkbM family methyltransferase
LKNITLPEGPNKLTDTKYGPMIYNKHDVYVGKSIEKYGEYSDPEVALMTQLIPQGGLVVEVGANMGTHTIPLAKAVGAAGLVIAFEPQRALHSIVCANAALNQLFNIVAFCRAVGNKTGTIIVPNIDYNSKNNFGSLSLGAWEKGEQVELQMLDTLNLPICHLIKIDVEGMEKEVLEGAVETIKKHRPVLYVENDRKEKQAQLIAYTKSLGYRLFWHKPYLYNPDNYRGDKENIFSNIVSINMLCIPAEANADIKGFEEIL